MTRPSFKLSAHSFSLLPSAVNATATFFFLCSCCTFCISCMSHEISLCYLAKMNVLKDRKKVLKSLLKHIGRKWCSIPLDFRAELILKSAEMTEIGKTLVSPSQLICMDSKTRDILSISVISADLRIKSARKSSGMEHHLRLMCFSFCVCTYMVKRVLGPYRP